MPTKGALMKNLFLVGVVATVMTLSTNLFAIENQLYCEKDSALDGAVAKINQLIQQLRPRIPQIIGTVSSPAITFDNNLNYVVCVRITTNN